MCAQLTSITPSEGDANGGTEVSISGTGFTALRLPSAASPSPLRCMFGNEVQTALPRLYTDSVVVCDDTFVADIPMGQPVRVALNGVSFTAGEDVRFVFKVREPSLEWSCCRQVVGH